MNNKEALLFPEQQEPLIQSGEHSVIGKNITEKYPDQIRVLANQQLWEKCRREHQDGLSLALLLDVDKEIGFVFNPNTQQIESELSLQQEPLPETITGVIVVCSPSPNSLESISANLKGILPFLSEGTPVIAFEDFPEKNSIGESAIKQEAQARKKALLDLGLRGVKISTRPTTIKGGRKVDSFLVWLGGEVPKNRKSKNKINLFADGPVWLVNFLENILLRATKEYEEGGDLTVLDDSEARRALNETGLLHNTIAQIELGFGFKVGARCGCCWDIDLNGIQTKTHQCESDCQS